MANPEHVHHRIAALSSELGGTVGLAARDLASQASVCVNADELFHMADRIKIPLMVEVMRRADAGTLRVGTSNDAAIVYTPSGAPLVMVVFCKGLSQSAAARAPQAIAGMAAELYEHLGERA